MDVKGLETRKIIYETIIGDLVGHSDSASRVSLLKVGVDLRLKVFCVVLNAMTYKDVEGRLRYHLVADDDVIDAHVSGVTAQFRALGFEEVDDYELATDCDF